eukprot:1393358-Amorphochlora_amoeboformis.AAC.1
MQFTCKFIGNGNVTYPEVLLARFGKYATFKRPHVSILRRILRNICLHLSIPSLYVLDVQVNSWLGRLGVSGGRFAGHRGLAGNLTGSDGITWDPREKRYNVC